MKLTIKQNVRLYDINLEYITQICGTNMLLKSYIKDSLVKHFSNGRYAEHEKEYINNVYINDKEVGREYFDLIVINAREDILKTIQLNKNSLMGIYVKEKINDFGTQKEVEKIEEILERLFINLNDELMNGLGNIEIKYETKDIMELIKDAEVYGMENKYLEQLNNYDLLEILINLLQRLQEIQPHKIMLLINNIDHILNTEEYERFVSKCDSVFKKSDSYVLLFTSIEEFVVINESLIEGINIINQDVFSFPQYEYLVQCICSNYPYFINKAEVEKSLFKNLKKIIHKIGNEYYQINLKSEIILKIINQTMCINVNATTTINELEYNFLRM